MVLIDRITYFFNISEDDKIFFIGSSQFFEFSAMSLKKIISFSYSNSTALLN